MMYKLVTSFSLWGEGKRLTACKFFLYLFVSLNYWWLPLFLWLVDSLDFSLFHLWWFATLSLITHTSCIQHLCGEWQNFSCCFITRPSVDQRSISLQHKVGVLQNKTYQFHNSVIISKIINSIQFFYSIIL